MSKSKLRHFALCLFSFCMLIHTSLLRAQDFPYKVVHLYTAEAGGGADFVARIIAQGLSANFGHQVVVDNRGGGLASGELVARAAADGYTLLLQGSAFLLAPLLRNNVPYDVIRDFAPISLVDTSPNILVIHPSLPIHSVRDLIALARARPGALNYASGSIGASPYLAAELFKAMADVKIVLINYRGTALALNELIGGQVQLMFVTTGAGSTSHIKSGRLKALAVTSAQPSALAPGLPTIDASGVPGYEAISFHALFAPAATPPAIIAKLNAEINRVIKRPDVREKFFVAGVDANGGSPEQFSATVKSEVAKWGKVIKDAGIRAD